MKLMSIGKAARDLGVAPSTLRRWEDEGRIQTIERTPNGHRRYDVDMLRRVIGKEPYITLGYARVARAEQVEQLTQQVVSLSAFCASNGWRFELIHDIGSATDYQRAGLRQLVKRLRTEEANRLVITHRDRLVRLGAEFIFVLCNEFDVEVIILDDASCPEDELRQDVADVVVQLALDVCRGDRLEAREAVRVLYGLIE